MFRKFIVQREKVSRRASLAISFLAIVLLLGWGTKTAHATPSTTYWTPDIMDIQPFNVWHLGIDNYFPIGNGPGAGRDFAFPTDVGLTVGVLPFSKVNMEVGIDILEPIDAICGPTILSGGTSTTCPSVGNALFFNAKIGIPEGALSAQSPGIDVGIFNVGTKHNVTNMDIADLIIGKTIPVVGRIHVAGYLGNASSALMHEGGDIANAKKNYGFMVAFDHGFMPVKDKDGNEYNKFVVAADYASGRNYIGGGGVGLYYYFTKDVSILSGPVWYNDHVINGQWKWTTQLDANF
jgi:hypothetical protein